MFNYLGNITDLSHHIVKEFGRSYNIAIDATLGNGGDCDFLSESFEKVYAFDIQEAAVEQYKLKNKSNVEVIKDSHSNMKEYIKDAVDVIMFNLGFLPGGDKTITTKTETTLIAIKDSLELLKSGGLLLIAVYVGHEEGEKEGKELMDFLSKLSKAQYGVMLHKVINRSSQAPYLLVIEKK